MHMDMVGGLLATTKGTFHLSRTARSLPHVVNDGRGSLVRRCRRALGALRRTRRRPRAGLVWLPGSREAFLGDVREHRDLAATTRCSRKASFGIPMVYFHDWPDVTIHTNKDLPENLDATKLGRVAYMGAGIAWTMAAAADSSLPAPAPVTVAAAGTDRRVPLRNPEVRGPLGVYYYDHLEAVLGEGYARTGLEKREEGGLLAYEALNNVDGRNTAADIAGRLAAIDPQASPAEVSEYLDLLEKARVLSWKQP